MPCRFEIRDAVPEDAGAVDEAICSAWEWAYASFVPQRIMDEYARRGMRTPKVRDTITGGRLYLVADVESFGVAGVALAGSPPGLTDFDAEIAGLYVHPVFARQGIGLSLFKTFRERTNYGTLCIHTLRDNGIGRSFYEKLGGTVVSTSRWHEMESLWYGWPAGANPSGTSP